MEKVPQHCIDKFRQKFGQYPSIIEFDYDSVDNFDKLTTRSYTIWFKSIFTDKGVNFIEKYIEYDASGIHFYVEKLGENKVKIFIMTTPDRYSVAEFTINNLIKAKNGNYKQRTPRENE
jgi:hypothetical protein